MAKSNKSRPPKKVVKKAIPKKEVVVPAYKGEKLVTKIKNEYSAEAIFALCGPIGSPIHEVAEELREILVTKYGYTECKIIRLGASIQMLGASIDGKINFPSKRSDNILRKIDVANNLRKKFGASFLAEFAIDEIRKHRLSISKDPSVEIKDVVRFDEKNPNNVPGLEQLIPTKKINKKVAYIIDSIKNQEELDVLKLVYRDLLYFIGVFSPLKDRIQSLTQELQLNNGHAVSEFIDLDSGEEKHGITVRDTFPKADFFIRIHNQNFRQISTKLERFLDLIFEKKIVVPTPKETAMYMAFSAAKNSACLSRQVGAALTDSEGEMISVGWNDVPKFGGDLYKSTLTDYSNVNKTDHRCMNIRSGYCFNDEEKNLMVDLIYSELMKNNLLVSGNKADMLELQNQFPEEDRDKLVDIEKMTKYVLKKKTRIRSLVEFSRSIHAEMHAIIIGSQSAGNKVRGGKLFITTYPCHNCARHVIVAGVTDIYYIEPYTKSLTTKLHFDSITEDENEPNKVRLLLYEGVGPTRYQELFEMSQQRKQDGTGKMMIKSKWEGKPKTSITLQSIPEMEKLVAKHFEEHTKIEGEIKSENKQL